MRISDWSSDVCSSDLQLRTGLRYVDVDRVELLNRCQRSILIRGHQCAWRVGRSADTARNRSPDSGVVEIALRRLQRGLGSYHRSRILLPRYPGDRQSVGKGKGV